MATRVVNGRYEFNDPPIGQGGMGVVYRVFDTVTNRYVALKTIEAGAGSGAFDLFEREWSILAKLNHPNIVEILDAGVYREDGAERPYFVMPLLIGSTLDRIIKSYPRQRMPVQELVEIMVQVCRGLHAAHEGGLVHRDIKPSNIFVTEERAVRIIDFGVAHLADTRSISGIKGTLQYMAPEQMDMRPATPLSDLFSLGVVCYEALSGKRPFSRSTESAIAAAIRTFVPPPVSEINPEVNQQLARTIHKAMAKQPWHRFASAREFSDTLQKAFKNEPIERFDRERIQPRIDRAQRAHDEGDFQYALDILNELESEGHVISGVSNLREHAEAALRETQVRKLLDNARVRFNEEEFPLALQKLQDALECDPNNAEALEMKTQIERTLQARQLESSFRLADQYLEQHLFTQARRVVEEVLETNASNTRARSLLLQIDTAKREHEFALSQLESLYQSALLAAERGEFGSAKGFAEQLETALQRKTGPIDSEFTNRFKSLSARIDSELDAEANAAADARSHMQSGEFEAALAICKQQLQKRPNNPTFQTLRLAAEEALRNQRSSQVSSYITRIEAESDLDKKYEILSEAAERFPDESYFQQGLSLVRNRRELIASIIDRAHRCEEQGQYGEAISQWELLRSVSPQASGIETEVERLHRKREGQFVEQAKSRWIDQIKRYLLTGDYQQAQEIIRSASAEFPGDKTFAELSATAKLQRDNHNRSKKLLASANESFIAGEYPQAISKLSEVKALADSTPSVRVPLLSTLLEQAKTLLGGEWMTAQPFIELALAVDSSDPVARSLSSTMRELQRKAEVERLIADATELKEAGRTSEALANVQKALLRFPNELRLSQLLNALNSEQRLARANAQPERGARAPGKARWGFRKPKPAPAPKPAKPARPRLKSMAASVGADVTAERLAGPPVAVAESAEALPAAQAVPSKKSSPAVLIGIAGVLLCLVVGVILLRPRHQPQPAPAVPSAPAPVAYAFHPSVPAAKLTIDGAVSPSWSVRLAPGTHTVVANADGYQAATQTITVAPGMPPQDIALTLNPLPAMVRVQSWLTEGKLIVDGGAGVDLHDGLAEAELTPGTHQVSMQSGSHDILSFTATVVNGQPIAVSSLTGSMPVYLVSSANNAGTLYSNSHAKVEVDGATHDIPSGGIALTDLSHDLKVKENGVEQAIPLHPAASPQLAINVLNESANQNARVVIHANVEDATILVNNVAVKRPLTKGARAIKLPPGTYRLKLTKPGYTDATEQSVDLKAGDSKEIDFALTPVQVKSTLALTSLPSGTEILIDGAHVGVATEAGTFSTELSPGSHTVSLRKAGYEAMTVTKDFQRDNTTTISGDTILTEFGTLKVSGHLPPTAQVSVHREGDATPLTLGSDDTVSAKPGRYVVSISVNGQSAQQSTVVLSPGKTTTVAWTAPPEKKVVTAAQTLAQSVDDPSAWQIGATGWWLHTGRGFGWIRKNGSSMTVQILKQNTKSVFGGTKLKHVEFTAGYRDDGDQYAYSLDEHTLRRRTLKHGSSEGENKQSHGMEADSVFRLNILATPDEIKITSPTGQVLDDITSKDGSLAGKLGFRGDVNIVVNGR